MDETIKDLRTVELEQVEEYREVEKKSASANDDDPVSARNFEGMATDFTTNYERKLSALGNKVQEYIDSLKVKAEELIFNGFPDKIVQLNNIIETSNFKNKLSVNVHQDLNIPIPAANSGNTSDGLLPAKRIKYTNN
ncbi:Proteasome activator pa28 alpha subunit [Popillia japonica]|uniref:Proteasome activator pa28 alpha subunit n=1 Tax=Popillia japonica TaxID=7064 RepID=A0AAW1MZ24_POPJA